MRLLLLLLVLFLQSCNVYRAYPDLRSNSLTNLNFVPHNNEVELFFSGETEPQKDYIRIALFKEVRTGYSAPPSRLLKALQYRAKQAGADALIVMGTTESFEVFQDIVTDRVHTIPRNHMWAIAIRYIDNLEAGLNVLSHLTVETKGDIAVMEGGRIEVDSNGELNSMPTDKWSKYVYLHSYEYLVEQRKGWAEARRAPKSDFQWARIRRTPARGPVQSKVQVNYLQDGTIANLGITYLDGLGAQVNMVIRYDEQGRVVGREWIDSTNIRYVTNRTYSAAGQLLQEDYQRQRKGEALQHFLSVTYEYVSPEELAKMIDQEQVVKGQP